jgi:hypothetical protein
MLSTKYRAALVTLAAAATCLHGACTDDDNGSDAGLGMLPGPVTPGDGGGTGGPGAGPAVPPGNTDGGSIGDAGGVPGSTGPTGGTADGGGTTGGMMAHDHCKDGYKPDPRDMQVSSQPDEWKASNGAIDLVLPKGVLDWMGDRVWEQSHDAWHNIRRCGGSGFPGGAGGILSGGGGGVDVCSHTELVPEDQECENAGDGYQFLVMHRHMIQALKQSFPAHADLFNGFPKFPRQATDVPMQWRDRWGTGWSQQVLQIADRLENIEQNLSSPDFATEGDLGKYIQCGAGLNSIHGALHFKWVVMESPHSLGKQTVNIDNYMFWKLHGWIDDIWERYRVAKGLKPDEPKLKQALFDQCYEMHQLGHLFDSSVVPPGSTEPLPTERGYFHEMVRPILDKYCASCHAGASPQSRLLLGGKVTSAAIVQNLVGIPTLAGGQFQRVVAGNPNQSWLYLKSADLAKSAGCNGTCNLGVMPPTGQVTLTTAELDIIKKWIADGAPAPTQ